MNETTDTIHSFANREVALGIMSRADKGVIAPAPELVGSIAAVANIVSSWPGIYTTTHWHFYDRARVDGVDFYVGEEELGHIHLDGELHLATSPSLGKVLIAEGVARPFPYQRGWVCEDVHGIGVEAATALFRRNYESLQSRSA